MKNEAVPWTRKICRRLIRSPQCSRETGMRRYLCHRELPFFREESWPGIPPKTVNRSQWFPAAISPSFLAPITIAARGARLYVMVGIYLTHTHALIYTCFLRNSVDFVSTPIRWQAWRFSDISMRKISILGKYTGRKIRCFIQKRIRIGRGK